MRRSGRTTRTVDEAIQTLFTKGSILIPYSSITELQRSTSRVSGVLQIPIIVDPDYFQADVQRDIQQLILNRLKSEHPGYYSVDVTDKKYIIITAKTRME